MMDQMVFSRRAVLKLPMAVTAAAVCGIATTPAGTIRMNAVEPEAFYRHLMKNRSEIMARLNVGTPYVLRAGLANIQEGEAVVPVPARLPAFTE